jgi:hypothetical protein
MSDSNERDLEPGLRGPSYEEQKFGPAQTPTTPIQVQRPDPVSLREHVATKAVKQSRDKAQYVRKQKGHSLTLHLLFGVVVLWIPAIYISASPNHYWHA